MSIIFNKRTSFKVIQTIKKKRLNLEKQENGRIQKVFP